MKITTKIDQAVTPAKVLGSLPDYLSGIDMPHETVVLDYGNLANLRRFMVKHTDAKNRNGINSSMREDDWAGTNTWDDYLDLLDNGDEDIMRKIKIATDLKVAELSKKYKEELIRYRFDVTGEFFDVGLVLSGVPEVWLQPEVIVEESVKVDILINGAFPSSVDTKTIVNNSSEILAMVKILENHDVMVSLKLVTPIRDTSEDGKRNILTIVSLKDYDEPVNYRKMSAILSPAHLRRGVFKTIELVNAKVAYNYGRAVGAKSMIDLESRSQIKDLEKKLFKRGD
jgi:hypothetical protein